MTCVVACVGLIPAALSTGIGSQVQKPLALVVVGGILLAPVLILVILPVLIDAVSTQYADTVALFHALGFGWSAASATPTGE
jgi:cobalt-zinc-cadmium resistance protein CzcA